MTPGSTLGPYEVIALIGAGGMGEVYRARDPRLGREVAIKILPADRVSDDNRRRRFVQEAHAASALNHPHIVTIHEIETVNGIDFIVMEYIRGETLDQRISRQGLRLGEALRIAIPVADALAAAHGKGIVHRDLKPANVMVGPDGAVKVLDFGLAKLTDDYGSDDTHTRTREDALTRQRAVVGTPAYMAPEQATGDETDRRSDVFAFGAMLYEMVTGERAFAGKTPADTISAVLHAQPTPPTQLVRSLPRELERVILRCLRKDPDRRFQHMLDVKVELQDIKEESESGAHAPPVRPPHSRRLALAVMAVVAAVAVAATFWLLARPRNDGPTTAPPRVDTLTTFNGFEYSPSFSPDGQQVAFSWDGEQEDNSDIYVKFVGSSEVRRLTTHPANDSAPAWSPDGRQIAFVRGDRGQARAYVVSPLGGAERKLSDLPVLASIAWSPDGRRLVTGHDTPTPFVAKEPAGIHLVPLDGSAPRRLTTGWDFFPTFSPDGHRLAYATCEAVHSCHISVLDLTPALVPERTRTLVRHSTSVNGLTWSRDGTSIIYGSESVPGSAYLWRVAVDSAHSPERIEVAGLASYSPAMAPSRDRLAFARLSVDRGIYRLVAGNPTPQPVLVSSSRDSEPRFSPDGRRIVFTSGRSGEMTEIWLAAADGTGAQQLTRGPGDWQGSPAWSPDGRQIAFDSRGADGKTDIYLIDVDGGLPRQLTRDPGDENMPTWSRDGRWIYFTADHGAGRNVWRIAAAGGRATQLSRDGSGFFACESPDGRNVLYQRNILRQSPLFAAPIGGGAPREIIACVQPDAFVVHAGSIYYGACGVATVSQVRELNISTGHDRLVGSAAAGFGLSRLAISPDSTTILVEREHHNADLMLIENFR